ncbi:hypothetical protein [Mycobacterium montefiorense]|uniref:Uncharacterized protein n=1 Tax=Mycobacterium montefiorense TaxID=154654 RepID=A0AA37PVH5_9MYCO|nr:hypothetical protein [Mycobacterium montefiorense]GBG39392.1 hypothetical protein MmonteBS_37640 [Mycobacterium montefiorense]GKU33231.1 hypothetical protein NJB14191_05780 [Mycobacterium montefiorense]GKU42266.1 hypothetical protein NJB14192_42490 [Mycobacterium montefiorense]GKU44198.1 hypothetical protein NJB14194_08270 [Mycobacterium montefiorense]GKU53191.1 hypothetical protein NJB14195_44320 [Mycobacterium montefiorense]
MSHLLLTLIADVAPQHTGPDFGKASPIGLLVVVLLLIATLFLLRSMNRQLKKVPDSFDPTHPEPDQAADEGTDAVRSPPDEAPGPTNGSTRPSGPGDEPG